MSVDVSHVGEKDIANVRVCNATTDAITASPAATVAPQKVLLKCAGASVFLNEGEFKVFVESVVAMMGWKKTTQQIF